MATGWRPRSAVTDPAPQAVVTAAAVRAAFDATAAHLDRLAGSFRGDGVTAYADILDAEALIARDPAFLAEVVALLEDHDLGAVAAVTRVAERHADLMAGLESAELRERAADIRQVGRMVTDRLGGRVQPTPPAGPFVLLAEEVTAPDLLEYAEQVAGAVSVLGGPASHASIVARSLGVPLVVGVRPRPWAPGKARGCWSTATPVRSSSRRAGTAVTEARVRATGPSAAELRSLPRDADPDGGRRRHHAAGERRFGRRG